MLDNLEDTGNKYLYYCMFCVATVQHKVIFQIWNPITIVRGTSIYIIGVFPGADQ